MYIHCCGWNLRGWIWLYLVGIGIMGVVSKGMSTLGAVFHVLENMMCLCVGCVS